jgi:hypothetical protein
LTAEEIKALQDGKTAADAEVARLKAELEKNKPPPKVDDPPPEDPDLKQKAEKARLLAEKTKGETKRIESAVSFNHALGEFVKTNKSMLPKDVEGIVEQANKETYNSQIERANAIKSGLIQSFFAYKENVELLTASQKEQLEDFLKLAKNNKEERAEFLYDNVFDPAFQTLKRVRKATELAMANNGRKPGDSIADAHVQRMIKISRKAYLGEKEAV